MKMPHFTLSLLLLFLFHCTTISGQAPAASPGPAAPLDIYKILTKAGQFTILIRLLRSTQVGNQINSQLGDSNSELTFFAPTDNAFSSLKTGTLNSLSDQQKVMLVQFHLIPSFISISNFQTMSNPVQTQASNTYEFPLNITTSGSQVNITTGLVNTSISGTVYSDNQLAVYQVEKVLQPLGIFAPRSLPPAPAPAPPKSKKKSATSSDSPVASVDASGAVGVTRNVLVSVGVSIVVSVLTGAIFL
ncbi:fasciclin-like arabinogalactan protein 12 [Ziziphus jujuba]|uniref:Fasciclin-like arabinogalactan protein 12 n=2 Tax=Ziziphus jujuba TaxID=326968 RepID=A0A6P3ZAH5_ZIZJJ|nr:fasciclin-like arabinogalactan protein 12 [Ziziphus jujuba]KAH7542605.1 hypothetical protein FEM48_Zijuj02G0091800 [Ziziphus jujuba var. spinosa]